MIIQVYVCNATYEEHKGLICQQISVENTIHAVHYNLNTSYIKVV